jgi:hypothetical protein
VVAPPPEPEIAIVEESAPTEEFQAWSAAAEERGSR